MVGNQRHKEEYGEADYCGVGGGVLGRKREAMRGGIVGGTMRVAAHMGKKGVC